MANERTLKRRISRTFVLQAAAISVAAVISVALAAFVIKQVLVTEALRMEADYFWARYAGDPAFPLPDTRNLHGFLAPIGDEADLPPGLRGMSDGFHDVPSGADFTTVYVTTRDAQRLYLVFDGERVNELAAYFGLVPLVIVLVVLYLSVWLAFRASHRAVSPITWLAREVNRLDPLAPSTGGFDVSGLPADADDEVRVLARALAGLAERLEAFVERERIFTRDASHELRSPLTVIRIATDMLLDRDDLHAQARDAVERIRRSSDEMERLVDAFLLLAREAEQGLPCATVSVNDVVDAEVDKVKLIATGKPIDIMCSAQCRLTVEAPEQAVSSVIGNLLRNAVAYTDSGSVRVEIGRGGVTIDDSGAGMDPGEIAAAFEPYHRGAPQRHDGHGVGLTIVRRFADRFGWRVSITGRDGGGLRAVVAFPDGQVGDGAKDEAEAPVQR
ncbi:MAG: HAMP domain-containing sensor histidine kinase [Gammaproteobacteria bacterium]|nr:HAMP domain-containing sensor histidine kinase [Gammaproteobacteria bacterium]